MPYERILSPITIRNVTLKNRLIRPRRDNHRRPEPGGIGPNLLVITSRARAGALP